MTGNDVSGSRYRSLMPTSPAVLALGEQKYVSLVTFRKSGERVATPVWIARDGDSLIVTTTASTGKVKRLRNNPRVQLTPTTMRGTVAPDAAWVDAAATVEPMTPAASGVLAAKYKTAYRINEWIMRRRHKDGAPARVIIRIT